MTKISEEEPERYAEILKAYNGVLKLGAIETAVEGKNSNRDKLASLARYANFYCIYHLVTILIDGTLPCVKESACKIILTRGRRGRTRFVSFCWFEKPRF